MYLVNTVDTPHIMQKCEAQVPLRSTTAKGKKDLSKLVDLTYLCPYCL